MKPEAPTATVTLLVRLSRRPKAGLFANAESEATAVFALWETPEGVEPSTNEAPHCDSRVGLADETLEGISWTQILYVSLLQSVQVILVGNELGGFPTTLAIFDKVSGPVTVSTLVRVSVIQSVLPCFRQAILRTVGYNDWIVVVRADAESAVMPAKDSSAEQPVVRFWMTAARVALLQAGPAHMLPSQLFRG